MRSEAAVRTWAAGEFERIAVWTQFVAEQLCETAGLSGGHRILDVATGTGNAALAAARRQCVVTAIDCVPELLACGRRRAEADGLAIDFQVADAAALPFDAESFDTVLSTFGVMFVQDHHRAATELARVCRRGGHIALANWTQNGFIGQYLDVARRFGAPRTGPSPLLWGDAAYVAKLFHPAWRLAKSKRRTFWFRHCSAEAWFADMRRWYGPTAELFHSVQMEERAPLEREYLALARNSNEARDGTFAAPAEYMELVLEKA